MAGAYLDGLERRIEALEKLPTNSKELEAAEQEEATLTLEQRANEAALELAAAQAALDAAKAKAAALGVGQDSSGAVNATTAVPAASVTEPAKPETVTLEPVEPVATEPVVVEPVHETPEQHG